MKMIPLLIAAFGLTVLYSGNDVQAQMQSKSMTPSVPKVEKPSKPTLYVPQEKEKTAAQNEIDRIFEKYKLLTQQQDAKRDAKPMKNNMAKPARPNKPSTKQKKEKKQSAGGFAAILDRYERAKAGRSSVQSQTVTKPNKIQTND